MFNLINLLKKFSNYVGTSIKSIEELPTIPIPTMYITQEQLKNLTGISDSLRLDNLTKGLNEVLEKYNINTNLRIAHFLAQILHESGNLKYSVENLNYSKEGLLKTFPKYFNITTATEYQRNPLAIASRVYANRGGNGNEASQEGWKYRGRGALQTTFKDNYKQLTIETGIDFVNNPDLLAQDKYIFLGAGVYWNKNKMNSFADKDSIFDTSRIVNYPAATKSSQINGYQDRVDKLAKIKKILNIK